MDIAFLQHREVQQLQRLAERQQFVDLVLQRRGQRGQVGATIVWGTGQCLHQARHLVGADTLQRHGMSASGGTTARHLGPGGDIRP